MNTLRTFFFRLRNLFRKKELDRDLHDELTSHLEMHIADNLRAGMSQEEARRNALLKLGGLEQTKESVRDQRGFPLLESLLQDARFALRMLRKSPAFTTTAVLTLALGIGANTVTFGLLRAVLLTPLPHPQPDRLVMVEEVWTSGAGMTSWLNFIGLRQRLHSFEDFVPLRYRNIDMELASGPQRVNALEVTGDFFHALGGVPLLGRYFVDQDSVAGAPRFVVLSESLWRQSFGADPKVIGRAITIDNDLYSVVGVAPAEFRPDPFPSTRLWIALQPAGPVYSSGAIALFSFGRLKANVSLQNANADLSVAIQSLRAANPDRANSIGLTARAVSMHRWEAKSLAVKVPILSAATTLLLLIVCMNVANLLLAWTTSRRREWATRLALGASRWRIIRQSFILSLLLAATGTIAGIILADACVLTMRHISAYFLPYGTILRLDLHVLAYSLALCVLTAVVFGTAPALTALRASNADLHAWAQMGTPLRTQQMANRLLVSLEIALSMVLVCCTGLMLRTLYNLETQDLGIKTDNVLTFQTSVAEPEYHNRQVGEAYYWPLLQRLRALPGVVSVGATTALPINGNPSSDHIRAAGHFLSPSTRFALRGVMPGYFRTMGILMLKGREFADEDRVGTLPVVVVNDIAARLVFGDENPIGQQLGWGNTVIGVYKSAAQGMHSTERLPEIDLCVMQLMPGTFVYDSWAMQPLTVVLRTANPAFELRGAIRETVRAINPQQQVLNIQTLQDEMDSSVTSERFTLQLIGGAGILALILAAIGVYGLMSYWVTQKTREIGIRMALGASRGSIRQLILWQALPVTVLGIALGIPLALSAGALFRAMLFKVGASDPLTFLAVGGLIAATSLLAAWLPARRATRVDPMIALRYE
jgi:predicted permease